MLIVYTVFAILFNTAEQQHFTCAKSLRFIHPHSFIVKNKNESETRVQQSRHTLKQTLTSLKFLNTCSLQS